MLRSNYSRELPNGLSTEITIGPGKKRRSILSLFGGCEAFALSTLSQALLFQDILKPRDKQLRALRMTHGLGAGTFTVRGYWMAYHRDRSFPALDTQTFCPGFVGAVCGAETLRLSEVTGVSLAGAGQVIMWDKWETQLRFSSWLFVLQEYMENAKRSDPSLGNLLEQARFRTPMHFTDLEGCLCFMSRLVTMFREPQASMKWLNAAKAIGSNIHESKAMELFEMVHL